MSTNLKDRLIRIEDMPQDTKLLLEQGSKPYTPLIFVFVIGIVMTVLPNVRIIGVAVALVGGYVLFGVSNKPLFKITDKYVAIYLRGNERECNIVYLDEVVTWEFVAGKTTLDVIQLVLNDGSSFSFETVTPNKTVKIVRDLLPKREIKQKKKR